MRTPRTIQRHSGFTLMEVVVAIGIFALVGLITSQLVRQVVEQQNNLADRGARMAELDRAIQILQRDFLQLHPRSIRDQFGDFQGPIVLDTEGRLEFTRGGWRNPLRHRRSELQRVAYVWEENTLRRFYWQVLDRAQDSEPLQQTLLTGVLQLEFVALDTNGNEFSFWPNGSGSGGAAADLAALIVRFELERLGTIERVWEVPSV